MQRIRLISSAALIALALAGCGGGNSAHPGTEPTKLLAQTTASTAQVFAGIRANYTITPTGASFLVTDLVNGSVPVSVPAGARLRFDDMSLALDADGVPGQAYRLYKAAFNRTPDAAGLGFWIDAMSRGVSLQDVANGFVQSAEYKNIYGNAPTSQQIIDRYYQNILGRAGEQAGIDFWKGVLDKGSASPAQVLSGFSESTENQAGVIASIQSGVPYFEPGVAYKPSANAGGSLTADVGKVLILDGTQSTASPGRSLSYAWELTSKPAGSVAALVQASTARPAFIPDVAGIYEVSLTVSDGTSTSAVSKGVINALWRPAYAAVPSAGNFVYLESQYGDYVGGGKTLLYTSADTLFKVNSSGAALSISLTGNQWWSGNFVGPNTLAKLQPGYYGNLTRWPFHDPAKGGLDWSGDGRGCNTETGWFVVDSVTYTGTTLTAIDLRFEQHCEGGAAALHGRIRWNANDLTGAPGPVNPPPAGLWQPADGATPASGNYAYLESLAGDYIGGGRTYLYTDSNAKLSVSGSGSYASVTVGGDKFWMADFQGMQSLPQLQPGYYGDLQRYPFNNPVKGGLNWSGDGRGCNTLTGWFVVDKATYVQGNLSALDLRFEQHCEGGSAALHGKIHWDASATAASTGL
jgi:hypothetical protein